MSYAGFLNPGGGGGGGGTVTDFSFTDANGFTGVVTNSTTTPNLTLNYSGFGCAFSAFLPSSATNLTGDNTLAGLNGLTELYDTGSDFDPTTGTFTAPATGIYMFVLNMYLNGIDAAHNSYGMRLYGNTPAFEYLVGNLNATPNVINGVNVMLNGTCMVQMTAGDTLVSAITVSGGARTVGFVGFNAGLPSYFTFFQGARIG